ncbi:MAG: hypothetical protein WBB28_28935 [Crinalium sp.]
MQLTTIAKLAIAPVSLISGLGLLGASFTTTQITQTVTPYSSEQVIVNQPLAEPAKSLLMFGGSAIAVLGTAGGIFAGIEDLKRKNGIQQTNFTQTNSYPQLPFAPTPALPLNPQPGQNLRREPAQQPQQPGLGFQRQPAQVPPRNPANQQLQRQVPPNQQRQAPPPAERLPIRYPKPSSSDSTASNNSSNPPVPQPTQFLDRFDEIRKILLNIPTLLIYGGMGSGKTSKGKGGWLDDEDKEATRKLTIPTGMVPPNKQVTPNGQTWYDFRPLLPEEPESAESDDDIINNELRNDGDELLTRENTTDLETKFAEFVNKNNLSLENFPPPDEWDEEEP